MDNKNVTAFIITSFSDEGIRFSEMVKNLLKEYYEIDSNIAQEPKTEEEKNKGLWEKNIKSYLDNCTFAIAIYANDYNRLEKNSIDEITKVVKKRGFKDEDRYRITHIINPNVSLEVGYMLAKEKEVYLCKHINIGEVLNTDLRHLPIINFNDEESLLSELDKKLIGKYQRKIDYDAKKDNIYPIWEWNEKNSIANEGFVIEKSNNVNIIPEERLKNDLNAINNSQLSDKQKKELSKLYQEYRDDYDGYKGSIYYVTELRKGNAQAEEERHKQSYIKVSVCDNVAHQAIGHYIREDYIKNKHSSILQGIFQHISNGRFDYFKKALPSNIFANIIVVNKKKKQVLAIKRHSSNVLNARNKWGLGVFESMKASDNDNREEKNPITFEELVREGLEKELNWKDCGENTNIFISSISLIGHLGLLITAIVTLDLNDDEENSFLSIYKDAPHGTEHHQEGRIMWIDLNTPKILEAIVKNNFENKEILKFEDGQGDGKPESWLYYTKWGLYQIWKNQTAIGIKLDKVQDNIREQP